MSETIARDIPALLGLHVSRNKPMSSLLLIHSINNGLPVKSVYAVASAICPNDTSFPFRVIPKATLERRKKQDRLRPDEGHKLARIARIWSVALDVWKEAGATRAFLDRPHPMLEGAKPVDVVLDSEIGAKLVEDILGRLKYGTAA